MKLVELKQTCLACPSQWEGRLADGRYVYVRFRHGELTAHAGSSVDDAIRNGEEIVDMEADGDGYMDEPTMLRLTGLEYEHAGAAAERPEA